MQNFVYLAKLHEPLVQHEKNLGCSACLFAELSTVIDTANNYSRRVRFSDSAPTASQLNSTQRACTDAGVNTSMSASI